METKSVFEMSTEELWNNFITLYHDLPDELKEDYELINKGIKIKVPMIYITKGFYEDHPDKKKVSVQGYGEYNIENFYEEMELRKTTMREVILQYENHDVTEARVKE